MHATLAPQQGRQDDQHAPPSSFATSREQPVLQNSNYEESPQSSQATHAAVTQGPSLAENQQGATAGGTFHALYTKHKTQKHKIWQDGRLVLTSLVILLHQANPPPGAGDPVLDTVPLAPAQIQAIRQGQLTLLETEKFLLQVEGCWKGSSSSWNTASRASSAPSAAMQKLMQRKFRKPATKRPPPPQSQQPAFLQQRKRPLQPGELQRQYYGAPPPLPNPPPHSSAPPGGSYPSRPRPQSPPYPPPSRQPQTPHYPPSSRQPQHVRQHQPDHQGFSPATPSTLDGPPREQAPPSPRPTPYGFGAASPTAARDEDPRASTREPAPPGFRSSNHTEPARRNPSATLPHKFALNAFDSNGFYGEDEEEEEEDEPEMDHRRSNTPHDHHSDSLRRENEPLAFPSEGNFRANAGQFHSGTRVADSSYRGQPAGTTNETLTTDDLLDLFGGATQTKSIDKVTESKPTQGPAAAVEQTDDFALPPPSDSSDGEDE
jgi:hypothetical protein